MKNSLSKQSMKSLMTQWKWIWNYGKNYKKEILFYITLGLFETVFNLVSAVAGKELIDVVTGQRRNDIFKIAVVMVFMTLFGLIINSIITRVSLKISLRIQNEIETDIFEKIEDADWYELTKFHSGDILNRFNSDIYTIAGSAVGWIPTLIINLFNFIATFAVIMYYDTTMAILAVSGAPILLIASRFTMPKIKAHQEHMRFMSSKVMAFEQETFSNMDTIKSLGICQDYATKFRTWQGKYKEASLNYNKLTIKTNILLSVLGMLIRYAGYGWGVYRLWSGAISYGEMTLFLSQGTKLTSAFNSLIKLFPGIMSSAVSAGRIMELTELPKEHHDTDANEELAKKESAGFCVNLINISYGYEPTIPVIDSSYFIAKPNEIVALIGPSGEGKTTLLRLILGLISPVKGCAVLVDCNGNDTTINADTRKFLSYVPQDLAIFSGTIAENLRLVKKDADDKEIIEALQIACAYDFVKKLEDGINASIGEQGHGLSRGQSQRIAIARAVLRDAPILLLDEATSALDIETERKVLRNIIKRRPNKTCIVTTHRPTVLSMCQRVYQVCDHKIIELDEKLAEKLMIDF